MKVKLRGTSKLLLTALVASIGPMLTTSRAAAQDIRMITVESSGTVPVTCGFDTSATTNIVLGVNHRNQTLSDTSTGGTTGAAEINCNQAGATLRVATLTEGSNPGTVADGDLGLAGTVTVTQADSTTDTITLTWPASGSFSASGTETLQMGNTEIALSLTGTFGSGFVLIPSGDYTYTIGLTVAPP